MHFYRLSALAVAHLEATAILSMPPLTCYMLSLAEYSPFHVHFASLQIHLLPAAAFFQSHLSSHHLGICLINSSPPVVLTKIASMLASDLGHQNSLVESSHFAYE